MYEQCTCLGSLGRATINRSDLICCQVTQGAKVSITLTFFGGNNVVISALAKFRHRDRTRAHTLGCFGFFSSFEHAKKPADYGPSKTKNSLLKCDFLIFNYEYYCQNLVFIVKKTPNLIKKLFLCFVSKPRLGPINSQHNFK